MQGLADLMPEPGINSSSMALETPREKDPNLDSRKQKIPNEKRRDLNA